MKSKRFFAKLVGLAVIVSSTLGFSNVVVASTGTLEEANIVGSKAIVGEDSINNNTLIIKANGGKMQSADDNISFSYVPVSGDFTATMKIASLENVTSNTRAYLMVRNGLDITDAHISAGLKSSGQGAYEVRLPERNSGSLSGSKVGDFVRIVKQGLTFSVYVSDTLDFKGNPVKVFTTDESKNNTVALAGNQLNVGIAACDATVKVDYFNIVDGSGNTIYDLSNTNEDKPVIEEAYITNVENPSSISVYQGENIDLPSTVKATYSDGTIKTVNVAWQGIKNILGTQTIIGIIEGYNGIVTMNLTILEKEDKKEQENNLTTIYVAPNADDNGAGTINAPMSLRKAIESVKAGGTIYLKGGTYYLDSQLTIPYTNKGEEGKLKSIIALEGEDVVLDFSVQSYNMKDTSLNERGLQVNGDYWHIKGITIQGAADNGFYIAGKHNVVELCIAKGNRDTGIQIGRRGSSVINFADWPSDNLILNCTSYNNSDPATGENADGFAAKLTCGNGNVFDGCISYNNVDDGWDLFAKPATGPIGPITIRNCIAFRNGATTDGTFTKNSDGNGFKLGGSKIAVSHVVENCIAFENKNHGFTDNSNPGTITVRNCTSINNALDSGIKSNIDFARDKTNSYNILENCISFSTGKVGSDKYKGEAENCVFTNGGKWYNIAERQEVDVNNSALRGQQMTSGVTANDFVTLSTPSSHEDIHKLWRNADGSINIGNVFKIKSDSQFANRNLGADFSN
ncbi:Ig-like domain-containing protein [Cellulosilyticum ruminicola]|uniref:Ig-like domain-containing protein n=1 Tax=Cellulosilyticum ruminicola TaxID=425254 RepID=UPI0009FB1BD8|nr:Ig-like domain-containing protein [Cellulosilyticum ruminicola]